MKPSSFSRLPAPRRRPARLLLVLVLAIGFSSVALIGCGGHHSSSSVVQITVPTITTQPTTQTATVGAAASFSVVATGNSLQYQWYKDGTAISGATAATYTIAVTALTDTGSYYVVVTNAAGSVTSGTVTLTVSAAAGSTGGSNVTVN